MKGKRPLLVMYHHDIRRNPLDPAEAVKPVWIALWQTHLGLILSLGMAITRRSSGAKNEKGQS